MGDRKHHACILDAAAVDVALAAELPAVAIQRRQAGERGSLRVAERAQLRHQAQHGQRGDAAHAVLERLASHGR